jgi:hypothetical protein
VRFTGYVQVRRGLLEHLVDGRLTILEYATLVTLVLLASKDSGSSTINANTLGAFMGEGLDYESDVPRNRQRGKQRVLQSLETKGYIFREIIPHSKRAYKYWVDKYLLTGGTHKSRRLDLSKVFATKDVSDIRYANPVAEGVAETVAEGVASNKTGEKKHETRDYPSTVSRECASECDSMSASECSSMQRTMRTGECASECASLSASECASRIQYVSTDSPTDSPPTVEMVGTGPPVPFAYGDSIAGLEFVTGEDAGYRCARTGRRIDYDEARKIATTGRGL